MHIVLQYVVSLPLYCESSDLFTDLQTNTGHWEIKIFTCLITPHPPTNYNYWWGDAWVIKHVKILM